MSGRPFLSLISSEDIGRGSVVNRSCGNPAGFPNVTITGSGCNSFSLLGRYRVTIYEGQYADPRDVLYQDVHFRLSRLHPERPERNRLNLFDLLSRHN